MSDLQGRRAIIMGMNSEKGYEKLLAKVPLKEMSSYSTSLSYITGGRASFTKKFSSYELVPSDVQDKLLKAYEATQAEDWFGFSINCMKAAPVKEWPSLFFHMAVAMP